VILSEVTGLDWDKSTLSISFLSDNFIIYYIPNCFVELDTTDCVLLLRCWKQLLHIWNVLGVVCSTLGACWHAGFFSYIITGKRFKVQAGSREAPHILDISSFIGRHFNSNCLEPMFGTGQGYRAIDGWKSDRAGTVLRIIGYVFYFDLWSFSTELSVKFKTGKSVISSF